MSITLLLEAIDFSAHRHRYQCRKDVDQTPYINHPISVARLLAKQAGVTDLDVLITAILHDVLEDTETTADEIEQHFGKKVRRFVEELSDDKSLSKKKRKQLQIERSAFSSAQAKLVKLADKICNLKDLTEHPPVGWDTKRRREYFDWAKLVVERLRGTNIDLEEMFFEEYKNRP